ncbi:hypothetical protein HW273_08315 [Oribacterium sp. oral taxon 102]|uniref:hypothetical protein n=1 Tax=Oribacterium sp. oral taxon 102 TaxID=671214 RepID=UPI0015BB72ED|nr:hypothetical protein [Oribacterium sp. oral taxon 102]NWO21900.1 hypothetical protein [Oribacterium sp. oral taxon 102]
MRRKLQEQSGESIAEALLSTLVVALGALLFVTAVLAAQRMLTRSRRQLAAYYNSAQTLEQGSGRKESYTIRVSRRDSDGSLRPVISEKGSPAQFERSVTVDTNQTAGDGIPVPTVKTYR